MRIYKPFIMLFTALALLGAASAGTTTPEEQIRATLDPIVAVLKDPGMTATLKRERISTLIDQRFDFGAMAQRTLAQSWRQVSPEERTRFVELYRRMLQQTYFSMVEEYTNEYVEYLEQRIVKPGYAQVDTQIVTPTKPIPVTYRTRLKDGQWWIYDVVVEGVSLISNYRLSYQEIVQKEGIGGLLARMEQKLSCAGC